MTGEAGPGAGAGAGEDGVPPEQQDVFSAAHEVGSWIGETIASRLPDPHAAAARRGLDLRWLLLKYNIPGILLALLGTWSGQSGFDRMLHSIKEGGLLAPVGFVFFFVLLVAVVMILPMGLWLSEAISHLVTGLARGLVNLVRRAWVTRYIGYVLRVLVAAVVWSFVLAVGAVAGRAFIHFLTGA